MIPHLSSELSLPQNCCGLELELELVASAWELWDQLADIGFGNVHGNRERDRAVGQLLAQTGAISVRGSFKCRSQKGNVAHAIRCLGEAESCHIEVLIGL